MKISTSSLIIGFALSGCLAAADAQTYPQKTNLPTVYIETENGQAITSKETYIKATLRYVDTTGEILYDALGIRGRGNSTWGLAKKPYRIKFDKKQEFLGPDRAKAKSWTLIANYADKSLMRNALAAKLGTFAGQPFTAAAQFVDLVLNGQYRGTYQISDQIEVREKRVDIVEQADPITDESNITGGYLLEVDGFADSEPCYFTTAKGIKITVKSPDDEIINQRQVSYIKNYIQEFENALFSTTFKDPETGYRKYVDENTLISWYVASEMTANPDAFWSTYIYKNQDDAKIYWGPLWDYDIAFNNSQRKGDMTQRLVLNDGFGADLTGVWVRRMWEDPWFVNAVNEKWKSMVEDGLEDELLSFIDSEETTLKTSQALDNKLWPVNKRVYDEYQLFSTYKATVEFLRKFVRERISYLSSTFDSEAKGITPTPEFVPEYNYYYRIHNASSQKCADLTVSGDALCGNTFIDGTESQHWSIEPVDGGYYQIINRASGRAISDPAAYIGGSYQKESQLALADVDSSDRRQHWQFVAMPTGGAYAIANRTTGLAWNNSGGSTADGNPFISWTNDANNVDKPTRQWFVIRDEQKTSTGVEGVGIDSNDYIVTYSPSAALLKFIAEDNVTLEGTYTIVNAGGYVLMSGAVSETIDVSLLTSGIYILSWQIDGRIVTRKFVKP